MRSELRQAVGDARADGGIHGRRATQAGLRLGRAGWLAGDKLRAALGGALATQAQRMGAGQFQSEAVELRRVAGLQGERDLVQRLALLRRADFAAVKGRLDDGGRGLNLADDPLAIHREHRRQRRAIEHASDPFGGGLAEGFIGGFGGCERGFEHHAIGFQREHMAPVVVAQMQNHA